MSASHSASRFVALIFEINTAEPYSAATVWIKATDDERLKTFVTIDYQESFQAIGPLRWEAAEQVVRALKDTLALLAIECFEHTDADD